jgi:hypothetical protein
VPHSRQEIYHFILKLANEPDNAAFLAGSGIHFGE